MPSVDRRDGTSWVVVELTRAGELRFEEGTLEEPLRDTLGVDKDYPIFIPAMVYVRNGSRVLLQLMEGYIFISTGLPETQFISLERESPYVKRVLRTMGANRLPVLSVITDAEVDLMRQQLREQVSSDIVEDMPVRITQGTYAKLDGVVVGLEGDDAYVYIELRSFKVIRTIPRMFLEPLEEGDAA